MGDGGVGSGVGEHFFELLVGAIGLDVDLDPDALVRALDDSLFNGIKPRREKRREPRIDKVRFFALTGVAFIRDKEKCALLPDRTT